MGLRSVLSGDETAILNKGDARCRARFARYFPQLFAYIQSAVRDEERAREIVACVFAATFARHAKSGDEEFHLWLFSDARQALQAERPAPPGDGLSGRERDVVSLLFDAQLTRREVAILLGVNDDTVTSSLLKALRKLKEANASQGVPFLLRTT
jgi:DNA-directed RNA polymerase specialized sigma24 family protein